MAKITRLFPMTNPHTQHNSRSVGICTAESLAWCRASLKAGGGIRSAAMLPGDHTLNAQMAVLRQQDHDPAKQAELAGLHLVQAWTVGSIDDGGHLERTRHPLDRQVRDPPCKVGWAGD